MSRVNSRDDVLALLAGAPPGRLPVFSGLPSLTAAGLSAAGVRYSLCHTDAARMAAAAASTFEHFGFESAVVPFDLCVEAEVLGCGVDFQAPGGGYSPPMVSQTLDASRPPDIERFSKGSQRAGRVPLVAEAIRSLKDGVGRRVAVGAWVPGPFTLGWQAYGAEDWLALFGEPERMGQLLAALADCLGRVAAHYHAAGADFITVHEMGGSPQVMGPRRFRTLVQPALVRLLQQVPGPRVLSVCGQTDAVVADLAACGAEALSLDQCNDLERTRQVLGPKALLFGNIDPIKVISQAAPEVVAHAVRQAARAGASAIWPGCDLWPEIPEENLRALMGMTDDRRPTTDHG